MQDTSDVIQHPITEEEISNPIRLDMLMQKLREATMNLNAKSVEANFITNKNKREIKPKIKEFQKNRSRSNMDFAKRCTRYWSQF